MKLELLLAYRNLEQYIEMGATKVAWNQTMIEPYWPILTQGAPFPMDHMKPVCNMTKQEAICQFELLNRMNWAEYQKRFEDICLRLDKEDEDTMYIAIYPSMTTMPEGIYGTGVWGNIVLNINPINENATHWIPFVFAHEYHHAVWGDYWFCKQGGQGLKNTFLENLMIEGEADAFAMSLNPGMVPSWHQGVQKDEEDGVWKKFEEILEEEFTPEKCAGYMFGSESLGIPENAGYYYAIRIVTEFLKMHPNVSFQQLLKVNPNEIFNEARFIFRH